MDGLAFVCVCVCVSGLCPSRSPSDEPFGCVCSVSRSAPAAAVMTLGYRLCSRAPSLLPPRMTFPLPCLPVSLRRLSVLGSPPLGSV